MRYPVGTQFIQRTTKRDGDTVRDDTIETIVDYYTTTDIKGKIVRASYVAEHNFLGSVVLNYDIPEATIARSKIINNQ